jgi:hypothetical protein
LNDGFGLLHASIVSGILETLKQDLVLVAVATAEGKCQEDQSGRNKSLASFNPQVLRVFVIFQHFTDFFANLR